jgi:hypothetical protein
MSLAANVQLTDELGRSVPISNAAPGSTDLGLNVRVVSQPAGGAATDVTDRAGRLVGVVSVTGTVATDEVDRVARLLGHVVVDNASLPVTGTFFQATQPVSIATMPSTPVTGTFWQATQPISAVSLPLPTSASTETTLGTRLSEATFTTRHPVQGQALMAASVPVTLASNQSALTVQPYGMSDTLFAGATALAPAAGATIATLVTPPAGTYRVDITCGIAITAGALAAGDSFNMEFRKGAVVQMAALGGTAGMQESITVTGVPINSAVYKDLRVTVDGVTNLSINATGAGGLNNTYVAQIMATRVA